MKKSFYIAFIVPVLVLLALLAFRWAERSGRFDLIAVRIDNSGPIDSSMVADILKPYFGRPLQTIDADSLKGSLLQIAGLSSVSITLSYPHTMIVTMEPEMPAAVILRGTETYPVTLLGRRLPAEWADDSLPVLMVEGFPEDGYISSGLGLLIKRSLPQELSVTVEEQGVLVVENGIPVLLDGNNAVRGWKTWERIRTSVHGSGLQVDLRYIGQAVVRRIGEGNV